MKINKNLLLVSAVILVLVIILSVAFSTQNASAAHKQQRPCTDDCNTLGIAVGNSCSPSNSDKCTEGTGGNALCACEYHCGGGGTVTSVSDCQSAGCNGGSCIAGMTPPTTAIIDTTEGEAQALE